MRLLPALIAVVSAAGFGSARLEREVCAWRFAGSAQGWQALNNVVLEPEPQALVFKSTGGDPYAAGPPVEFTASEYHYIRIRAASNVSGDAQIYWAEGRSAQDAQFRAEHFVTFRVEGDGRMRTHTVLPPWTPGAKVFRIRLDLPDVPGAVLRVAEFAVVERPVEAPKPEPAYQFQRAEDAAGWIPYADVASLEVRSRALRVVSGGPEPLVLSPVFRVKSEAVRYLAVNMAVKGAQTAQLRCRGETSAISPAHRLDFAVAADGRYHTYNVELSQIKTLPDVLTRFAVGLADAGAGASFSIRWVRLAYEPAGPAEPVIKSLFGPGSIVEAGAEVPVTAVVRNVGAAPTGKISLRLQVPSGCRIVGSEDVELPSIAPMSEKQAVWHVVFPEARTFRRFSVKASLTSGGIRHSASASFAATRMPTPNSGVQPGDIVVRSGPACLVLAKNKYGYGPCVLYINGRGGWQKVGAMASLGTVAVLEKGRVRERAVSVPPKDEAETADGGVELNTSWKDSEGRRWTFRASVHPGRESGCIDLSARLSCGEKAEILGFAFPELLVGDGSFGEARDIGLFPGLEYLLPGERSSGTDFAASTVAKRLAPHPHKVTVPLMSIIRDAKAVGLMWDPKQRWDGTHDRPIARFASPNFVYNQPNHWMSLAVPGLGEWFVENSLLAGRPFELEPGREISLGCTIFAVPAADVDGVMRLWIRWSGGLPTPPAPPYGLATQIRALLREYTQTAWVPEQAKWHRALSDPWGPSYTEFHALHLLWELERGLSGPEGERARQVLDAALRAQEASGGDLGFSVAFHRGGIEKACRNLRAEAVHLSAFVRADGSVPFRPEPTHAVFGKTGDSSSGHTATTAWRLWQLALITGSSEAVNAGLRAIAYLDTQKRPEGAQTWELPLHVPDVLAAAHAVRCCVAAYQVTGDKSYLRRAVQWAYRGLPFIYLWGAPDRPIMLYGSIPVFGATWFTGAWFGRIVQWNGLEFADALLQLSRFDSTEDWRRIAEGITNCALRQQRPIDRKEHAFASAIPDCGHAGMYPDSYDPVAGTDSYHWCLSSEGIANIVYKLNGIDPTVKFEVLHGPGGKRVHVSSVAYVSDASFDGNRVRMKLKYPVGLTHHLMMVLPQKPNSVRVGSSDLEETADLDSAAEGWKWDSERGFLYVKLRQRSETVQLFVEIGER
ncbi:MAG: NEW3 domain-containing protein [Armatimonadota bacterium]